jgi:hypothetical protein
LIKVAALSGQLICGGSQDLTPVQYRLSSRAAHFLQLILVLMTEYQLQVFSNYLLPIIGQIGIYELGFK